MSKRKPIPGENRRITKDMIQWAKEKGACPEDLRAMRPGMTFREYFESPMGFDRQLFVVTKLRQNRIGTPWSRTEIGSEAEFREFLKIVNEWEIV
jgi:hypothetical protein